MTGWNRATDGPPPDDPTDGWGWGTSPVTGQPFPRPHLRHWAPNVVFADGTKPEPCWCASAATQAPAPKDTARRRRKAPDTVTPPQDAPGEPVGAQLDDATATRLLITWLKRAAARR